MYQRICTDKEKVEFEKALLEVAFLGKPLLQNQIYKVLFMLKKRKVSLP